MRSEASPFASTSTLSGPARQRRRRSRARVRRTPTGVLAALALISVLAGASMLGADIGAQRGDVAAGPMTGDGAATSHPAGRAAGSDGGSDSAAAGGARVGDRQAPGGLPPVFARHEGVTLRLPVTAPLGVRFTQGWRVGAVPLEPMGALTANANPQGFDASQVVETANGPEFAVAAPAGRGRPPTSAAVVSLAAGRWVRSPLTGRVLAVAPPPLDDEGRPGWRLVLHPDIRPELRVTITGLHQPRVGPGDAVAVGETVAAPRLIRDGIAEVTIEMAPAGAPITVRDDEADGS